MNWSKNFLRSCAILAGACACGAVGMPKSWAQVEAKPMAGYELQALPGPQPYVFAEETTAASSTPLMDSGTELVRERYADGSVKIAREVAMDPDGNYVNHGSWKMWDRSEKLVAEGQYSLGQPTGVWNRWHDRGDSKDLQEAPFHRFQAPFISQATFKDGLLDGDWVIFDRNQEKCSHISFQRGERHGPMTLWLPGGQIYAQRIYEDNVPVGDVIQRSRSGELETLATYADGRRVTTKVSYFPGKRLKKAEAQYLGTKTVMIKPDDFFNARFAQFGTEGYEARHGQWRSWYSNGQLQIAGYFQNDVEAGVFTWWHPNGQKAVSGQYVDGLQHGEWVWWHANGQKDTVGRFAHGAQAGTWRRWTEDGQLDARIVYEVPDSSAEIVSEAQPQERETVESAKRMEYPILPWMKSNR